MSKTLLIIIILSIIVIAFICWRFSRVYKNIYFIGDSHTKSLTFPNTISGLFGAKSTINAYNGASASLFTDDALSSLKAVNPDLIIVRLGTNDIYRTEGRYNFQDYRDLIARIKKYANANIVVTTIENSKIGMPVTMYNNEIKKLSGVKVIDLNNLIDYKYQTSDKIHFTSEGYKQQGEAFYREFNKLF